MGEKHDCIPFLEGWDFRPQKDVHGFYELCRPCGTVVSIVPIDMARRLAAALAGDSVRKTPA
jgi:hypothetical protein